MKRMELTLIRSVFGAAATLGKLYANHDFFAYTLEDVVRNIKPDCSGKIQNQTAIGYGRYEVVLSYSSRFQKYLPLLPGVPCFSGIRIHGGNTNANTEGCILIGAKSDMQGRIWNCAGCVASLVGKLKAVEQTEKIWINIAKAQATNNTVSTRTFVI